MAIIELIKWNAPSDCLAWKFDSEELATWSQLVVNESQEAFLVHGGVYEGPFQAGRHTLKTENIPVLRALIGLPFGGQSPFSAEVWFVNKTINLDIKWGTLDPIQLQDPKFSIMVPVRAFGQYGVRVSDSKRFLLKLVGTLASFDSKTLSDFFRGVFVTKIKTEIAKCVLHTGVSILEISTHLEDLSEMLLSRLGEYFNEYGLTLVQFNIQSINVPEEDPAVVTLKKSLAKRTEMGILGFNYQQERSFDVMQAAASNEGNAGGMMGAGLGLGVGVGVGAPLGNIMGQMASSINPTQSGNSTNNGAPSQQEDALKARIALLKELSSLRDQGVLTDDEFSKEKSKILGA